MLFSSTVQTVPTFAAGTLKLQQLSSDPYTNSTSNHRTEIEPDTYAYGTTIVAAYQAGRFFDGGSSNNGWATSADNGHTWKYGFLPDTTTFAGGPYDRISDPTIVYDAKHRTWLFSSIAILQTKKRGLLGAAVVVNRSTDGGFTWSKPVAVAKIGPNDSFDKDWITCDNSAKSKFYGHCYSEWDNNGQGGPIQMSTSTDGGQTWGKPLGTADHAVGLGGQPIVQPNGRVIVPISAYVSGGLLAFTSNDGGQSWSKTVTISPNAGFFASAGINATGTVYVVWPGCPLSGCVGNGSDLLMSTSTDGVTWTAQTVIPIDPGEKNAIYFIPGLGVDRATSGQNTHLGLAFYFVFANCTQNCGYRVGFVSSSDNGATWSRRIQLAGPMLYSWFPTHSNGSESEKATIPFSGGGNPVGDYIATSFVGGKAFPVFSVAYAPSGGHFNEAMYTVADGLSV